MTDTQTENVEPKTSPLPGGGVGIHMPSGELVNPVHCTVKGLTRLGPSEYAAVLEWVEGERQRAAERLAEREAELEITMSGIRRQVEARHAALAADLEAKPWKRDQL